MEYGAKESSLAEIGMGGRTEGSRLGLFQLRLGVSPTDSPKRQNIR